MEKPEDKLHDDSGGAPAPAAPQPSVTEMSVEGSPKGGGTAHQVRPLQVGRHPKPRETAHDVVTVTSSVLHETPHAVTPETDALSASWQFLPPSSLP